MRPVGGSCSPSRAARRCRSWTVCPSAGTRAWRRRRGWCWRASAHRPVASRSSRASRGRSRRLIASGSEWMSIAGVFAGGSDLAGLSADGSLAALQHAEHGDITHPALRIVDPRTGAVVADRGDGRSAVVATVWSPVPGDQRLAVIHEPEDRERVGIWDLATDAWHDLDIALPGDHAVLDWFPGGDAVLLQQHAGWPQRAVPHRCVDREGGADRHAPRNARRRARAPGRAGVVHAHGRRASGTGHERRRRRAARSAARAGGQGVSGLAVHERSRPAGPRLDRGTGGRGPASGDGVRARRAALALRRRVHAGGAGLRRCGVSRGDAELPWLHRLWPGLARRADRRPRVHRRRRRDGGAPRSL